MEAKFPSKKKDRAWESENVKKKTNWRFGVFYGPIERVSDA